MQVTLQNDGARNGCTDLHSRDASAYHHSYVCFNVPGQNCINYKLYNKVLTTYKNFTFKDKNKQ